MLRLRFHNPFSSFKALRFYNHNFEWNDEKWGVNMSINPPQISMENLSAKIEKQSGLTIFVYPFTEKYKKGRVMENYFLKMQDMLKLGAWSPSNKSLNFINTNKIVSIQRDSKNQKAIVFSFYDKNLSEELKRKELVVPLSQFVTLQTAIQAGAQEITNGGQQKLSYIYELMKTFPPNKTIF